MRQRMQWFTTGIILALGVAAAGPPASAATVAVPDFPVADAVVPDGDFTTFSPPWVAWTSTNEFVAVWQRQGEPNTPFDAGFDLIMRRFDANGVPVSPEVRIAESTRLFSEESAEITLVDANHFVVAWPDFDPTLPEGQGIDYDLYAQVFNVDGSAASLRFPVNPDIELRQVYPGILPLPGGAFAILYRSNHPGSAGLDIYARRFSMDGRPLDVAATRLNTTTAGAQSRPQGDCSPTLCFVAWTHNPTDDFSVPSLVHGQYLNPDLTPNGPELVVASDNSHPSGASVPHVAMQANNAVTVSWVVGINTVDGTALTLKYSRYRANRSVLRNGAVLNNKPPQGDAFPVNADSGAYAFAWSDSGAYSRVLVRDYLESGAVVTTPIVATAPATTHTLDVSGAAVNADGRMVVLWVKLQDNPARSNAELHGTILTGIGVP